jgi:AcrR family transcriptional regulator
MGSRYEKEESRKKILSACVRLVWVQGFRKTPPKQILQEAGVSAGTFYNLYKSKAGVLMELTDFMFSQQFGIAGKLSAGGASPALVYALETSIQLALTELNENLREIYIEVYTQPDILERIRQKTTAELQRIFGPYLPECSASDFYEMDIGTAAIMRGYMERPCDLYFTLERKIECFLRMTLTVYHVPEAQISEILQTIAALDIRTIADSVMQRLFTALQMKYEFTLTDKEEPK